MPKRKSKKSNFRNRWLVVIGVFIILFLVTHHALPRPVSAPAQTNTRIPENWKSGKHGDLTFKFPPFYYGDEACDVYRIDIKPIDTTCNPGDYTTDFDFVIYPNMTLDQVKTLYTNEELTTSKSSQALAVNGHNALLNKTVFPPGYYGSTTYLWELWIVDGKKLYRFRSIYYSKDTEGKDFDKILSTFKFTN